jgi:hypothetical protein
MGVTAYRRGGVMEWWSNGVVDGFRSQYSNTPILQYSSTPNLQYAGFALTLLFLFTTARVLFLVLLGRMVFFVMSGGVMWPS